jgi:hypothetical protein
MWGTQIGEPSTGTRLLNKLPFETVERYHNGQRLLWQPVAPPPKLKVWRKPKLPCDYVPSVQKDAMNQRPTHYKPMPNYPSPYHNKGAIKRCERTVSNTSQTPRCRKASRNDSLRTTGASARVRAPFWHHKGASRRCELTVSNTAQPP